MNPAVLTRLDQLEQEWQQRLLMQPSSGQADKKKRRVPTRLGFSLETHS